MEGSQGTGRPTDMMEGREAAVSPLQGRTEASVLSEQAEPTQQKDCESLFRSPNSIRFDRRDQFLNSLHLYRYDVALWAIVYSNSDATVDVQLGNVTCNFLLTAAIPLG